MTQAQTKEALCHQHKALLYIILRFGNGAMLLPQLRALCLALHLYPNAQAVNRAVRALKDAGVLTRQTWIDGNSDLLLARKYAYRHFSGGSSQDVATPRRPATMGPHILIARKIDWLLSKIEKWEMEDLRDVNNFLFGQACTIFLRRPELPYYYRCPACYLENERPENYQAQLARLEAAPALGSRQEPPSAEPVTTLEASHRRGVYVTDIFPYRREAAFALFANRETTAERVADWAIDAYSWLASLLPYCKAVLTVYALDANHAQALRDALTACESGSSTNYWHRRLEAAHIEGLLHMFAALHILLLRWYNVSFYCPSSCSGTYKRRA